MNKNSLIFFIVLLLIVAVSLALGVAFAAEMDTNSTPKVPFIYSVGVSKYHANCSACHGQWLEGTKQGPPLLHPYYKPSHHNDASFYRAALNGVRAHHWNFGNMPRINGVTREDMDKIIPFIRWFQKENGIY
jgi:hypothetical protein